VTDKLGKVDPAVLVDVATRWLQALTDGSREMVVLLDARGKLRFISAGSAAKGIVGYDALQLSRMRDLGFIHPNDRDNVVEAFRTLAADPGGRKSIEYRVRHARGNWVSVHSTATNRLNDPIVGSVVVHTRGVQQVASEEATPQLQSRKAFTNAVGQAVRRAAVDQKNGFSVLLLELERHKMLVGNYGQEVVDQLLTEASRRVTKLLRPGDVLGRLGGGELAVLFNGVSDKPQAGGFADKIQKALSESYQIAGETINTSAIAGIATSERVYEKAEHVIRDAALAANRARARGRRRRAVFQTQMRVEDSQMLSLVSSLHGALPGDQFRLYYQPIVSLKDHSLVGFEALIRWFHPSKGIISPTDFIPIAEETGLIVQIGLWVLREACRQMAQWNRTFKSSAPLYVSVNLSPKQLDDELAQSIEGILHETGLPPSALKLEVTESAVLENTQATTQLLERLKQNGVRVSLDDFGTGYSSFSYLHQLPYDTLKIDRSFVSSMGDKEGEGDILHAIITLAHNLHMDVVAEGVETASQAKRLGAMWCEYGQGFFFARPVDAEAAAGIIQSPPQW
jgi:diguanylate cyclase (GGDEF)-like protein/PAS domain S-box-containing protein